MASTGLAAAVLVAGAQPAAANGCASSFSGGSGSPSTPFLISTAADLNALQGDSRCWGYSFLQTADISMGGASWATGIGTTVVTFTGAFDGGGYVISELTIGSPSTPGHVGLFGSVNAGGTLTNIGFTGTVTGDDNAYVGGLVGWNSSGASVSRSHSSGTVSGGGFANAGGIAGANYGSMTTSFSTASVNGGANATIGGLVGYVGNTGTVSDSYAQGDVTGADFAVVGGLVGQSDGSVSDSYATGAVAGGSTSTVGGFLGVNGGSLSDSFSDTETSGTLTVVGAGTLTGATGKTTAQITTLSTFADAGWSIAQAATSTTTWGICSGSGYPYLVWQYSSDPCSGPAPSAQSSETFTFTFDASTGGRCFTWTVTAGPVTLPDARAACTPEGTALVGWTVPGQANAFSDGGTVIASGDQTFTAVARHPRVQVTYDANVGHDAPCLVDGIDTAERAVTVDVPRDGVLADRPTCTPAGVQFVGWTDRPTTDGPSVAVPGAGVFAGGSVVPGAWSVDPDVVNAIRLYAMWRQAEPMALRAHTTTPSSHSAAVSTVTAKPGQFCKKADRSTSVTTKSYGKLTCRADRKNDRYSRWYRR